MQTGQKWVELKQIDTQYLISLYIDDINIHKVKKYIVNKTSSFDLIVYVIDKNIRVAKDSIFRIFKCVTWRKIISDVSKVRDGW